MPTFVVRHATTYRYANPVRFDPHRLMLRPRDSHDLRLVSAKLTLSPPGSTRWVYDVFGNSVAIVTFDEPASELYIESLLTLQRFPFVAPESAIDPDATSYPFTYSADDRSDLGRTLDRHYPDPKGDVERWARSFIRERPTSTMGLLSEINEAIRTRFLYTVREAEGTLSPVETLALGSGSCRDFALLFIEAVRSLGFGARFVSGYLYDPALDTGAPGVVHGAGATHAWAEIYLPGPGWIEFDPTNGFISEASLIRIAVARDPTQAAPISGGFFGGTGDYLGMNVEVAVTAVDSILPAAA